MLAVLNRLQQPKLMQTLGHFTLYDGLHDIFECKLLELPDRGNQRNISRIDANIYTVVRRTSEKFGDHFHILDVEGRSLILMHFGNFYTQTEGCQLPGRDFFDLNNDGLKDVTSSKATMKTLLSLAPDGFTMIINDLDRLPGISM